MAEAGKRKTQLLEVLEIIYQQRNGLKHGIVPKSAPLGFSPQHKTRWGLKTTCGTLMKIKPETSLERPLVTTYKDCRVRTGPRHTFTFSQSQSWAQAQDCSLSSHQDFFFSFKDRRWWISTHNFKNTPMIDLHLPQTHRHAEEEEQPNRHRRLFLPN